MAAAVVNVVNAQAVPARRQIGRAIYPAGAVQAPVVHHELIIYPQARAVVRGQAEAVEARCRDADAAEPAYGGGGQVATVVGVKRGIVRDAHRGRAQAAAFEVERQQAAIRDAQGIPVLLRDGLPVACTGQSPEEARGCRAGEGDLQANGNKPPGQGEGNRLGGGLQHRAAGQGEAQAIHPFHAQAIGPWTRQVEAAAQLCACRRREGRGIERCHPGHGGFAARLQAGPPGSLQPFLGDGFGVQPHAGEDGLAVWTKARFHQGVGVETLEVGEKVATVGAQDIGNGAGLSGWRRDVVGGFEARERAARIDDLNGRKGPELAVEVDGGVVWKGGDVLADAGGADVEHADDAGMGSLDVEVLGEIQVGGSGGGNGEEGGGHQVLDIGY